MGDIRSPIHPRSHVLSIKAWSLKHGSGSVFGEGGGGGAKERRNEKKRRGKRKKTVEGGGARDVRIERREQGKKEEKRKRMGGGEKIGEKERNLGDSASWMNLPFF